MTSDGAGILEYARTIRQAADHLLTHDLDGIDAETTVRIAHELAMARKAIIATEEFVAKHAGKVWPTKWQENLAVEGVGVAYPYRTKSSTTWDHEGLIKATVEHHMAETGGDLSDPFTIVRAITDAAHVDYWRVKALKERDIDVDDYRATTRGNIRLAIQSDDQIGATTKEAS